MTSVIEFSKWQRDAKSPIKSFGPAQLVIFPGVRVERLDVDTNSENFELTVQATKNTA